MKKKTTYVEYDSNNSGGRWWLTDDDWLALERAGWKVSWFRDEERYFKTDKEGRWLGALASKAIKPGAKSLREAADEWERITGKSATDAGCPCCGQPHNFKLYVNDKWTESGPEASYVASW